MKRLHRLILGMLPGPILGWLGALMFLLLMQFLIKYLPDIAGKGLPLSVIGELVAYNLAYMLVLAVPMSVLIGTMMVFGRIAETRAYLVVKTAGASPVQLMWPTFVVGLALTVGMTHFNNVILPEANFRARNLWQDIRQKRPGFELQPGVFYGGLQGYSILVQEISPDATVLRDVVIYDYTDENRFQAVIKAREGRIHPQEDRPELLLTLFDGEVHRLLRDQRPGIAERYERLGFERHRIRLDLSDFNFERGDPREGYRSDRTTRTSVMMGLVDSLEASSRRSMQRLETAGLRLIRGRRTEEVAGAVAESQGISSPTGPGAHAASAGVSVGSSRGVLTATAGGAASRNARTKGGRVALSGVDSTLHRMIYDTAVGQARMSRTMVDDTRRGIEFERQRANRFRVEIHKKYSIALACLIFVLIGAPLGLSIRRGGLGRVGLLATAIFLFYWVTLVQGEKWADRGFLSPWFGMWMANIVMIILGLWLMVYVTLDLRATLPLRKRLIRRLRKTTHD